MQPTGFATQNEKDVSVFQRNHTPRERKMTTLYFVGIDMMKAMNGAIPNAFIKGSPLVFPPLGESITVDEVVAKDIIEKTRWSPERSLDAKPKDVFIREEHGGREMARMIKEALANGTSLDELDIYGVQKQHYTRQLSDEELLRELQARGMSIEGAEPVNGSSDAHEKEVVDNPAAVKKESTDSKKK